MDPYVLQKLAKVESMHIKDSILCTITIPIVTKEEYMLKRLYSLPIIYNNKSAAHYNLDAEYLITSQGSDKMMLWDTSDLKQCQDINTHLQHPVKICRFSTPLYLNPGNNCIPLLYKNWAEARKQCTSSPILDGQNTITRMCNENKWLYYLHSETDFSIECPNFKSTIRISRQGIVTLNPGCVAQTANLRLTAINTLKRNATVTQTQVLPLTEEFKFDQVPTLTYDRIDPTLQYHSHQEHTVFITNQKEKYNQILKTIEQTQAERKLESRHNKTNT